MTDARRVKGLGELQRAFDEVRFGAARTLNLRALLPTPREATSRLDGWLRQHQMQRSGEVLVVTGRGNNSTDGISVVREASLRLFHELERKGVIEGFAEHTPGSFVVTLAPVHALVEAANRPEERAPLPAPAVPPTLALLDEHTRSNLRTLAERSLDSLGMRDREPFLEAEMLRLFGSLAATIGTLPGREERLRAAIDAAMGEYD